MWRNANIQIKNSQFAAKYNQTEQLTNTRRVAKNRVGLERMDSDWFQGILLPICYSKIFQRVESVRSENASGFTKVHEPKLTLLLCVYLQSEKEMSNPLKPKSNGSLFKRKKIRQWWNILLSGHLSQQKTLIWIHRNSHQQKSSYGRWQREKAALHRKWLFFIE